MRTFLKNLLHYFIPAQSKLYFNLWINWYWKPKEGSIQHFLNVFSKGNRETFFIQIGSNDGILGDPIHKFIRRDRWRGIMVEPLPFMFKELKRNYQKILSNGDIWFEQLAISNESKKQILYYVKDNFKNKNLPEYLKQQASFNLDHLKKEKKKYPEIEIEKIQVQCEPLNYLIKKYKPKKIDLIHTDTEGHDYTILKGLDLHTINPKMVFFEHQHLSIEQIDFLKQKFLNAGYSLKIEEHDTLAYKLSAGPVNYFMEKQEARILAANN